MFTATGNTLKILDEAQKSNISLLLLTYLALREYLTEFLMEASLPFLLILIVLRSQCYIVVFTSFMENAHLSIIM